MAKQGSRATWTRRRFLRTAAGAWTVPWVVPASVVRGRSAPSNRIAVACVGCGARGNYDLRQLAEAGASIVALCDVNRKHLAATQQRYGVADGAVDVDYRAVVGRPDVDAVLVATNDHWHVLAAMAALKAGKDIYVEKPLSRSIREGRALVEAVKKSDRVFMHGTEQRAMPAVRHVCQLVRNGRLGKVRRVLVACPGGRRSGPVQPQPVPEYLDFERYTGPAPRRRFDMRLIQPRFHWHVTDYCPTGFMAGWGIHLYDVMQWALDLDGCGPEEIEGRADYPPAGDLCDAPLAWEVHYRFPGGLEMKFVDNAKHATANCVRFEGQRGWVEMRYGGQATASDPKLLEEKTDAMPIQLYRTAEPNDSANFIACCKSRRPTCSPIEAAHRSTSIGLLGAIACRLGRKLRWDWRREVFPGDEQANALLSLPMRKPWTL